MEIATPRLIIRDIRADDTDALAYTKEDKYSYHKATRPHPEDRLDIEIARNVISMSEKPQRFWSLVIALKETQTVIGSIRIYTSPASPSIGEIGFDLNEIYWRKDYTTEAVRAVTAYCHDILKMHRVSIRADVNNIASWRVAEKAGMQYEGIARYDFRTWQGFIPEMKIYASVRPELIAA